MDNMDVSINGGTPRNGWFRITRENPIYKWMMTRGTPISGNHQIGIYGSVYRYLSRVCGELSWIYS